MVSIATPDEIKIIIALAKQYDGGFSKHVTVDVDISTCNYLKFHASGMGVVLALKNKQSQIIGGLGAIKFPDIHNGQLTACETFWFCNPDSRGHGFKLFRAFEEWARQQKCQKTAMIHLEDSYPDRLKKIYEYSGYQLVESHYIKELKS